MLPKPQAPDTQQLELALDQLDANLSAIDTPLPEGAALIADAGYLSEDNIKSTESHGLDPFIATGRFKHSEPQPPASRGPVPKDATPKQRMARKVRTKKGRAVYARRKAIVEPVFGQIHTVQDGRRLLLGVRGLLVRKTGLSACEFGEVRCLQRSVFASTDRLGEGDVVSVGEGDVLVPER